ncbi:hypothetical protein F751_0006 [Auxenochlorella protothecoides]|uniref:Uncharacterized protein n=1 Tax=Auxenochlorella protothecoides TaxID=3075 RepID=A0A087S9T1_AUXPR|nr:hypothetical protein F751_0006 [Auxenochlorella protothecoides]KFM22485.1 hypothetical protein F751_0006 [Auxenochlorella protothecoides]
MCHSRRSRWTGSSNSAGACRRGRSRVCGNIIRTSACRWPGDSSRSAKGDSRSRQLPRRLQRARHKSRRARRRRNMRQTAQMSVTLQRQPPQQPQPQLPQQPQPQPQSSSARLRSVRSSTRPKRTPASPASGGAWASSGARRWPSARRPRRMPPAAPPRGLSSPCRSGTSGGCSASCPAGRASRRCILLAP